MSNFLWRTNEDVHWKSAVEEQGIDLARSLKDALAGVAARDNQQIKIAVPLWLAVSVRAKEDDSFGLARVHDAVCNLAQQVIRRSHVP